ncbi:MAG: MotA/TolQ/ExbB proton channel family protein [Thermodesulfovibrionia bacterium]|nr:MotA/TolQ/ExbB proton channel family protein [Thermodesulfovibrionia bacterium]
MLGKKMKPTLKQTMIAGGIMTICGPIIGGAGFVLGMISAADNMGSSTLSKGLAGALISTAIGTFVGLLGLYIFIASFIIWLSSRSREAQSQKKQGDVANSK